MVFDSLAFIVFFACVLAMQRLPLGWTHAPADATSLSRAAR